VETTVLSEINRLRRMTVAELRAEWLRLNGEPARSRNRDYLFRRLAWRVQEIAHGGLSDAAKARLDELGTDTFTHTRTPRWALDAATTANVKTATTTKPRSRRDRRLPTAGTIISRHYHGREIRVLTLDDGFELDGQHFTSLSAVAKAVTGAKWNGRLFFGLTERKRKS
jgi:hypothetical protein